MSQSLAQIYVHIVFSTKDRRPFLQDTDVREELHKYLGGTCSGLGCPVLRVGGVADHAHLLCRLDREISIADLVKGLKPKSSEWLKTKAPNLREFYWQSGYGAFSVSPAQVEFVREYIACQEQHHRSTTFQEEFRRLLTKYGVEWDERFVWD